MTGQYTEKYSAPEKAAVTAAFVPRVCSARRVSELAAAGKLSSGGVPLEAFTIPASTVRSIARDLRRRRAGQLRTDLESAAPRDAVEQLRVRLVRAISHEMRGIERRQRAGQTVKGEELRQLARAGRELSAIPSPTDPRPPAPGVKRDGVRDGSETRGGLAGSLIADHRATLASWSPAPVAPPPAIPEPPDAPDEADDDSPGAWARRQVEALGEGAVEPESPIGERPDREDDGP